MIREKIRHPGLEGVADGPVAPGKCVAPAGLHPVVALQQPNALTDICERDTIRGNLMNSGLALLRFPKLGKLILDLVVRSEGGQQRSRTLRRFVSDYYGVEVGMHTYGGCFARQFNNGGRRVGIGRYCSFGQNIHYFGANHPMGHISMSAYWYNASFGLDVDDVERVSLTIGNDVWVGYGVIITPGCKQIGNGAVVGAGSVVTKDVQAYSINVGVPAKKNAMRFSEGVVTAIESSAWWNREPEELYSFYRHMSSPEEFVEVLKEESRLRKGM